LRPAHVSHTQLKRGYYSNREQLMADANMIVAAARTYHMPAPGVRRLTPSNINVVKIGENMVAAAVREMQGPDALYNLDYWEGRVKVRMACCMQQHGRRVGFAGHDAAVSCCM
jgi:hypothetical protein